MPVFKEDGKKKKLSFNSPSVFSRFFDVILNHLNVFPGYLEFFFIGSICLRFKSLSMVDWNKIIPTYLFLSFPHRSNRDQTQMNGYRAWRDSSTLRPLEFEDKATQVLPDELAEKVAKLEWKMEAT